MEVPSFLQPKSLLKLTHEELASQLQDVVRKDPTVENVIAINTVISELVSIESLPSTVYPVWLPIGLRYAPELLGVALLDSRSHGICQAGIHALARAIHGKEWKQAWDGLGGAGGIMNILSQSSLSEVHEILDAIMKCKYTSHRAEISSCVEELVGLLDEHSARPLGLLANKLLPLCGSDLVQEKLAAIQETIVPDLVLRRIVPFHVSLLRRIAVGAVDVPPHVRRAVIGKLPRELVVSPEPYILLHSDGVPSDIQDPRIAFCLDLFHVLNTDSLLVSVQHHIPRYVDIALRLVKRGLIPFEYILLIIKAALSLAIKYTTGDKTSVVRELIRYWSIAVQGNVSGTARLIGRRHASHHYAGRPRAEHKHKLESMLIEIFRDNPHPRLNIQADRRAFVDTIKLLLGDIAPAARLAYLELLFRHGKYLSFDLASPVPSDREKALLPIWSAQILHMLPAADAQRLFNRSLEIHGCTEFLPGSKNHMHGMPLGVQHILKARWEAETGAKDYPLTHKALEDMKSHAQRERDPAARLKAVKTTVWIALESLSVHLFHSVLGWTKNFIQETTVFPNMMDKLIVSPEVATLLSCVDVHAKDPHSLSKLASTVEEAHRTLDTLLGLTLSWLNEPSNPPDVMEHIPALFCAIVHDRIVGCAKYHRKGLGTAAELTDTLLHSLLPVILRYERAGYRNEQRKVNWPSIRGLIAGLEVPGNPLDEVVMFMDRLAQEREKICQNYRKTMKPDVVTLDRAWPRGLAIQHLMPSIAWARVALSRPHLAPFVATRFDEVIFAQMDVLMLTCPKDINIVGRMVDDLYYAVEAYAGYGKMTERITRTLKIWQHYERELADHPVFFSAFRFWLYDHHLFKTPRIRSAMRFVHPPVSIVATYLNDTVMPDEVVEWDPYAGEPHDTLGKEIDGTVLFCRMNGRAMPPKNFILEHKADEGPAASWLCLSHQLRVCSGFSLPTCEAITLSGILLLESFTKQRVLPTTFPKEAPRYPAIYLDGQFVNSMQQEPGNLLRHLLRVLGKYANTVPTALLRNICHSLLDRLTDMETTAPHYAILLSCSVDLVKIISRGHKPEAAMDVVWRILSNLPHEPSYHREMQMADLASRLRPEAAREFIERCAQIVCEGLASQSRDVKAQEGNVKDGNDPETGDGTQSQETGGKPEDEENPENGPNDLAQSSATAARIITAKQLANTLGHAEFLPAETTLKILDTLFTTITHIHVRVDIVSAVLVVLEKDIASEQVYSLLASLSKLASGPSEDATVTEEDWIAAENGVGPLPQVSPARQRPLLNLFVARAYLNLPDRHLTRYMNDILFPILDESTAQHTRWMKAFLSRLDLPAEANITNFPFGPFDSDILDTTLNRWKRYLPASFLARHRAVCLSHLHHNTLTTITMHLTDKNSEFRQTNYGRHWLECIRKYREPLPFTNLQSLLGQRGIDPKVSDGLTAEVIGAEYRRRVRAVILSNEAYSRLRDRFVISVDPVIRALWDLRLKRDTWMKQFQDERMYKIMQGTMEGIVQDIEELRTETWKMSSNRQPETLPSQLQLQAILIPSPSANPTVDDPVKEFVERMLNLVRMCAEDPVLTLEVDIIKEVMRTIDQDKCRDCALLLGDVKGTELGDCLRVYLAQDMVLGLDPQEKWLDKELQAMIGRWKTSSVEFIRRLGWGTE